MSDSGGDMIPGPDDLDDESRHSKTDIKFFVWMTVVFFVIPILIINIPGVEKIGSTITAPFMKIIDSK